MTCAFQLSNLLKTLPLRFMSLKILLWSSKKTRRTPFFSRYAPCGTGFLAHSWFGLWNVACWKAKSWNDWIPFEPLWVRCVRKAHSRNPKSRQKDLKAWPIQLCKWPELAPEGTYCCPVCCCQKCNWPTRFLIFLDQQNMEQRNVCQIVVFVGSRLTEQPFWKLWKKLNVPRSSSVISLTQPFMLKRWVLRALSEKGELCPMHPPPLPASLLHNSCQKFPQQTASTVITCPDKLGSPPSIHTVNFSNCVVWMDVAARATSMNDLSSSDICVCVLGFVESQMCEMWCFWCRCCATLVRGKAFSAVLVSFVVALMFICSSFVPALPEGTLLGKSSLESIFRQISCDFTFPRRFRELLPSNG